MSSDAISVSEEFVCMHGHPLTPAGQLKIRGLQAAPQGLSRAERLLIEAVVYGMSTERLRSRVEGLSPSVAEALQQALKESGKTDEDPRMAEVRAHIRRRELISAIKLYREISGCGLFEAKEACEKLQRELTR